MSYPMVVVVEHTRKQQAFSNPIVLWTFRIKMSARCKGLIYQHGYKTWADAHRAGKKKLDFIKGAA